MLEKSFHGNKKYWTLVFIMSFFILIGLICFIYQLKYGLILTGLTRDVPWGFYISQFTYFVGIGAAGVIVVLPFYIHNRKDFANITILGEFMAVASVMTAMLFIFVSMGKPSRVFNVIIYATPHSIIFWDFVVLMTYLFLNLIIGWSVLDLKRNEAYPPKWVKVLIYISIPWAPLIHIITAFLYSGLPGKEYWHTAIMAPRFLSSAFASGTSLLVLLSLIIKRNTHFDVGEKVLQTLTTVITYAIIINVFFFICELFTVFYSQIPDDMNHFKYLFSGINGYSKMVFYMWSSIIFMLLAILLLLTPYFRRKRSLNIFAFIFIIIGTWIDKGIGNVTGGFIPNSFGYVNEYWPTSFEILLSLGVYASGFLVLTVLYKIAIEVDNETNL